MKILGIDPGMGTTGWAVIQSDSVQPTLVAHGAIRSSTKDEVSQRLLTISDFIYELMQKHRPDVVAIEDVFVAKDARAALRLGQARGAAIVGVARASVPVYSHAAREVKMSITGNGRATKDQVGYMVARLLSLPEAPAPADCADAAAIALCHMNRMNIASLTESAT